MPLTMVIELDKVKFNSFPEMLLLVMVVSSGTLFPMMIEFNDMSSLTSDGTAMVVLEVIRTSPW